MLRGFGGERFAGETYPEDGFFGNRCIFATGKHANGPVAEVVDRDTGNARTPEALTDPVAVVPIEDHTCGSINEDWFCTKPPCAPREAEEITGSPFLQSLVRLEKGSGEPLDSMICCHGSILPVSIVL